MDWLRRITGLAFVGVWLFVGVTAAQAQTAPGYEEFSGCLNQPNITFCIRSETTGGHIQIGKTDTPMNKLTVLSGGLDLSTAKVSFTSKGGLIAPPLNVPGGLTGLTGLSEFIINLITFGANQVQAQAILVGDPILPISTTDLNLTLPVRIKLINPFLASTCSIGSSSNPVLLKLTTGTTSPPPPNKPLSGVANVFQPDPVLAETLVSANNTLVDNAFAAPAATGCDLIGFGLINGLVNARVGLPAAAGTNTAVFSSTKVKLAQRAAVYP